MTFLLMSSSDGVCEEGVFGRLSDRNDPEFDVGGDGVPAVFRREALKPSTIGDKVGWEPLECGMEYGWLLGPVEGRD